MVRLGLMAAAGWLVVPAALGQPPQQPDSEKLVWKWAGIEVIGQKTASRESVLKHIPLEIGSEFTHDADRFKAWGEAVKNNFGLHYVHVYPVRYADFKAYLVVDIVERGDESRMEYRPAPRGQLEIPGELIDLHRQVESRLDQLFSRGQPSREDPSQGYLDYADAEAHELVLQLIEAAKPHRETLIKVLNEDNDSADRARAATLLNWAGNVDKSIIEGYPAASDPDAVVRNNITRFMLHFVGKVDSPEARRVIIDAMTKQLGHPFHGDRNKAVYALITLADAFPKERPYIKSKAGDQLRYIAETSILSNVADPAKDLLAMLDERPKP